MMDKNEVLYYVGPGVIGSGERCVRHGDVLPGWLSKAKIKDLIKKGHAAEQYLTKTVAPDMSKELIKNLKKEKEELKKQLEEANEIIKNMADTEFLNKDKKKKK